MNTVFENDKIKIVSSDNTPGKLTVASVNGDTVGGIEIIKYGQWQLDGITFFTEPEHRRCGYAAAAVHAVTRWYYDTSGADMLVAVVPLENVAAIRTLERAGYEYVRSARLTSDDGAQEQLCHLYLCSRSTADAGAPPKGCCCGCGGHTD